MPVDWWRAVTRYQRPAIVLPDKDEVRPIKTEACTKEEALRKFAEYFDIYEVGGGADLRMEMVRGLEGVRFTVVFGWGDMG